MIKALNTYAMPVVAFSFGIIKWSDTELLALNRSIRVQFTKHLTNHPNSSIEKFHLPRSKVRRGVQDLLTLHNNQISSLRTFFYQATETSSLHKSVVETDKNHTPLQLSNKDFNPHTNTIHDQDKQRTWTSKEQHGRYVANIPQEQKGTCSPSKTR